jgi:hypothetical protein
MADAAKYGPWAVVTGASAGLGEHFARQLAAKGFHLVLVARRVDRLAALASQLESAHGILTRSVPLDLVEEGAAAKLDEATADLDVGLLVDNAGFGYMGKFHEQELERLERMVKLNCLAVLSLAHRFARRFLSRGRGGVVIVASLAGFQATPYMAAYGATKGFDLLLGEGIGHDLKGTGVDVVVLNPGSTHTEFGQVAESRGGGAGGMQAAPVVAAALRALGRKPSVVTGLHNKLAVFLDRLFPRTFVTKMSALTLRKMVPRDRR